MNRLIAELQRLYFPSPLRGRVLAEGAAALAPVSEQLSSADLQRGLAGEATLQLDLAAADGTTRGLLLNFARRGDWPQVAALHQALQEELELPAPAVAINADDGYQLWLSLAEAVPLSLAQEFLAALRSRYLGEMPATGVACLPGAADGPSAAGLVPSLAASGKWSAFIDPSMGSMFSEESGLDMAPNLDRQADMLAGLSSIAPDELQRALKLLLTVPEQPELLAQSASEATTKLALASTYSDPQSFLLAVMNDPSASAGHRIEAAKALLPYFAKRTQD